MRWNHWRSHVLRLSLGIALGPGSLLAQGPSFASDTLRVDLSEVRSLALERNPAFLAEAQSSAVARGELRQAGTYALNPELEAELPGASGGAVADAYEIRISQGIEWAGQRGLRSEAAGAGLEGAVLDVEDARRRVVSEVTRVFYGSWAADQRLAVVREILGLNERLLEAVETQVREGEISVMDSNFARIEVARSRGRVLSAEREARTARIALGRLVGAPAGTVIAVEEGPEPVLPDPAAMDVEALIASAMAARPDLGASRSRVAESEALVRLARREAIPVLGVGALLQRDAGTAPTRVGLQVELSFPIWNRNQGLAERRLAEVERATFESEATLLAVRSEVWDAHQAYLASTVEETVFADQALAPARQTQALLETAYREGEIDLPSLILLRNQLLDAEIGYWDAWLARRLSFADLEAAVGTRDFE